MAKANGEISIKSKLEFIKERIENSNAIITINEFLNQFEEIMLSDLTKEDFILIKDFFKSGYFKKIQELFQSQEKDKEILVKKLEELEDKIETLENENSQQKYINEIQKRNLSDLKEQDEIQKNRIYNLEKQSREQESINKSQKQRLSDLEKKNIEQEFINNNQKQCISDLQKQNIEQESINRNQKQLILDLKEEVETQKQSISDLKKENIEHKSINQSLNKRLDILEKKYKSSKEEKNKFKKNLEDMILGSVHKGQDEIEKENILKEFKERDNYKAILYTILISIGLSFDEIYLNLNDKFYKNLPNIKQEFIDIFLDSHYNLKNSDDRAHESSTNNILEKLFPKYSGLSELFTDQILNGTKEVIKDLPLFKLGIIKAQEFKVKKDKITELIRKTFSK